MNNNKPSPRSRAALATASLGLLGLAAPVQAEHVIDALVVYSPGVTQKYSGDPMSRINHLALTTNSIYKDSGVDARLRIVHAREYPIDDTRDTTTTLKAMFADKTLEALRDTYGADVVIVYRPYANDGMCGLAYVSGYAGTGAYAHVSADCGTYVTAHEVGHIMGLGHSWAQNQPGIFNYAIGHGVQNSFATVMAYQSSYGQAAKIYKFSSPRLDCNGQPCGVPIGQPYEADAVHALSQTVPNVAAYRDTVVPESNVNNTPEYQAAKKAYDEYKAQFEQVRANYLKKLNALRQQQRALTAQVKAYNRAKAAYDKALEATRQERSSATATTLSAAYQAVDAESRTYQDLLSSRDSVLGDLQNFIRNEYKPALAELERRYKTFVNLSQAA